MWELAYFCLPFAVLATSLSQPKGEIAPLWCYFLHLYFVDSVATFFSRGSSVHTFVQREGEIISSWVGKELRLSVANHPTTGRFRLLIVKLHPAACFLMVKLHPSARFVSPGDVSIW